MYAGVALALTSGPHLLRMSVMFARLTLIGVIGVGLLLAGCGNNPRATGSADAIAQVMPPWADTVCERVGKTLVITAVL